jgi:hypothetical protein
MAKKKIGQVYKPTSGTRSYHDVYWDDVTKEVYVGGEYAGKASSQSNVLHVGDVYCSTGRVTEC